MENIAYAIFIGMTVLTGLLFVICTLKDSRRFRNSLLFLAFFTLLTFACIIFSDFHPLMPRLGILLVLIWIFLILIVPFLLIINGFVMLRREGFSIANLLSMLFGVLILAGEFATYHSAFIIVKEEASPLMQTMYPVFAGTVFYVSYVFLAFMFYTFLIRIIPRKADFDYVIVLGAGLLKGEKVSKLLADRLDKGKKVYDRSFTACRIIVSGGKGPDEKISEAQAMKNYLVEKGVPEEEIIMEDASADTMENLINSKAIIEKRKGRKDTAVVTSSYHIYRAMIYARRIGFPVTGIGAHIALYYWPSAMIREYAALVKYYWKWYFSALLVWIVFFTFAMRYIFLG